MSQCKRITACHNNQLENKLRLVLYKERDTSSRSPDKNNLRSLSTKKQTAESFKTDFGFSSTPVEKKYLLVLKGGHAFRVRTPHTSVPPSPQAGSILLYFCIRIYNDQIVPDSESLDLTDGDIPTKDILWGPFTAQQTDCAVAATKNPNK